MQIKPDYIIDRFERDTRRRERNSLIVFGLIVAGWAGIVALGIKMGVL